MSVGIFIMFFLYSNRPGPVDNVTYDTFTLPVIERCSIALERLDDFDKNPEKPEDNWVGMDKFWHWALAFTLTGSSYHFIHNQCNSPDPEATVISISSVLVFSVLKELYDLASYNLFSIKDLCYDVLGIASGYMVFIWDWDS